MIMTPVVYVPPKRDSHNGMKDQGGGEISSEEGEPKGGNPCGEHGPEVYFFRADPIRDAGENYERDRVADLEPGDNGTGLGRRHCPFPPEHREGPRIGHEEQAIEEPRSADPGKPPVESSPFNRIRYHSLLIVIKIENQNNLSIWLAPSAFPSQVRIPYRVCTGRLVN